MAKKLLNEEQVSSLIYRMVRESLDAMPSNFNFEADNQDNDNNSNDEKKRGDKYRQEVEAFFKQPGVNPAQYAYDLYGVKPVEGDDTNEMKNARSKFMKCLNHETNQDGYEYAVKIKTLNVKDHDDIQRMVGYQIKKYNACRKCLKCESICRAGAINISGDEYYIDPEKCVHCKMCMTAKYLDGGCTMDKYLRTK